MTLDDVEIEDLAKRMIPGAIAIAILFFLMHPSVFIDWFFNKAILYVILFFFYKPVAKIIIERKLNPGDKKLVVIGLILFIPYVLLMGMTIHEIGITLLQLIVILSFFWAVLGFVKEKII